MHHLIIGRQLCLRHQGIKSFQAASQNLYTTFDWHVSKPRMVAHVGVANRTAPVRTYPPTE